MTSDNEPHCPRLIGRVIAEKPAPHLKQRVKVVVREKPRCR